MNPLLQLGKYLLALSLMVPMYLMALLLGIIRRSWGWRVVHLYNRTFLAIFGITIDCKLECSEQDLDRGGVLVGLTQQSLLDPTIGYAALNRQFMAVWNLEYALIPVFGWVAWVLGWVIIRQSPQNSKRQLAKAAAWAADGGLIYLSAEGRRSKDGSLSPYKKGPSVIAIESQSQVLPLYIQGSRHCMPHGEWKIRSGHVSIKIMKPVSVAGMTYADRDKLTMQLRELGEAEQREEKLR